MMVRALVALSFGLGCGGGDGASDAGHDAADVSDAASDAVAGDGIAEAEDAADDAEDARDEVDAAAIGAPSLPSARGFSEVRVIAHLHSAFSHDGCDQLGLDADGAPNMDCVHRLKRALCSERIGQVFMTDHPSHMNERTWDELFYPEEGETRVLAEDGTPFAIRYQCGPGEGGPDGRVTFLVGFEGTHTMPLGLRKQMDWDRYHAFEDATAAADLDAVTAAVRESGGHVAIAHSEEGDLSAATIAAHDVSAMEIYNFHANFNQVLGSGLGDALFSLEAFLDPSAPLPDPDLTALILLSDYPVGALDKWRVVSAQRPITAITGADAHENVSFEPACKDTDACDGLASLYPNLVAYLKVGGPVWQSDGERLDGYARVFRWAQNRVLVPAGETADPVAVEVAFFAGRTQVVFGVLGEAPGVALVAEAADGSLHDLGATVARAGTTLWARSPDAPTPAAFAEWRDGSAAEIESVVWRSDASGVHEVARWSGAGVWRSFAANEAGSYQLEVWITPRHLIEQLGPAAELAEKRYRWVETNAIRLE